MKNTFIGYYQPSALDFKKLWGKCLFIVDTNVLLDLYRYSDSTRKELLKLLGTISTRLWLPHQVGLEFHNRRLDEISRQVNNYQNSIVEFDKFLNKIKQKLESKGHPYVEDSNKYIDRFSKIIEDLKKELGKKKESFSELLTNDKYLREITNLLKDKIGNSYSEDKLEELYKIGEKRCKNKIPPGYKDYHKAGNNKYGDIIIWNQIIDKSIDSDLPIIFITSETKEDWWLIHNGKTIGPRPELINEFRSKTKNKMYIYQTDNFLRQATEYLDTKVESSAIDEVKRVSQISFPQIPKNVYYQTEKAREAVQKMLDTFDTSKLYALHNKYSFDSENLEKLLNMRMKELENYDLLQIMEKLEIRNKELNKLLDETFVEDEKDTDK